MNTQTFAQDQDFTAITDEELMAVNGGSLSFGNLGAGVFTGVAANRLGVDMGNQGAGAFSIGTMIAQGKRH